MFFAGEMGAGVGGGQVYTTGLTVIPVEVDETRINWLGHVVN